MKGMNRLLIGAGASAVVVATVAGVTLGITTLLGVTFEESEPKPAQGLQPGSGATNQQEPSAQTGQYPGFAFCVQAIDVDPALETVGKASVQTALLEVMQHPYWAIAERGLPPPIIDLGCPSAPLPAHLGVSFHNGLEDGIRLQYVPEPSFYRRFVFVMPLAEIDQLLGGTSVRIAAQEIVAHGDTEGAETFALYLTPEELQDSAFMLEQLLIAVGFKDPPY